MRWTGCRCNRKLRGVSQRLTRLALSAGLATLPLGVTASVRAQAPAVRAQAPTATNGAIAFVDAPPPSKSAPAYAQDAPGVGTIASALPGGVGALKFPGLGKHDVETVEYSPDGKQIAWLSMRVGAKRDHKADGIYVAAADGSGARQVVTTSWTNDFGWSADSKSIVYSEVTSGVYTVPADGSAKPKDIYGTPESGGTFNGFTSSPDGTTWLFAHEEWSSNMGTPRLLKHELWRMNADGSGAAPLFPKDRAPRWSGEPDLSPDGRTLVFWSEVSGRPTVVVAPFGTTDFSTIYRAPKHGWVDGPTWSPDGKAIVVTVGSTDFRGPTKVLTIDPVTKAITVVAKRANGALTQPTWRALT